MHLSLREYFTSKSDEGLPETYLLTGQSEIWTQASRQVFCATLGFHVLIFNNLWDIVNTMTYDSFHILHLEIHVAATVIYSLKQKRLCMTDV